MFWLCVTMMIVLPISRAMESSSFSTTTPVSESSAPVGSSQSRMSGFFASARAMETRCCSPPESSLGNW